MVRFNRIVRSTKFIHLLDIQKEEQRDNCLTFAFKLNTAGN